MKSVFRFHLNLDASEEECDQTAFLMACVIDPVWAFEMDPDGFIKFIQGSVDPELTAERIRWAIGKLKEDENAGGN